MITLDAFKTDKTDQELWTGIRQGDELCFTIIFDRYHGTLYNYGCKLSANSAIVEDAVQDVFIDIWRLRNNLTDNIISIKFYLYRALRRRINVSHDKFPVTEEITMLQDQEMPATISNSETMLIEGESTSIMAKRIQELICRLPERQVEALTLRYFDDFSIGEIARIMGVNEKSVRNFIYKALTSLRSYSEFLIPPVLVFFVLDFYRIFL
ncbi:RNA polymerase sigma factor [Dyadobacter sp. NIV53]|uniref:RNA polymerase sigma factor n=1 Tax=Dyadobacter sp. NIV53 TaxID=2861765 RepID=UPI001E35686D|nr:sigma-70 family RNA polymerase sigma factor [Dyadobacter sp. NIV53]